MTTTYVYVDGFNVYHGVKAMMAVQNSTESWRWLDHRALAQRLVPDDTIGWVRYFTARVTAPDHDPQLEQRQQAYLRALVTLPELTVHYGQFKVQKKQMPLVNTPSGVQRLAIERLGGVPVRVHPDGNCTVPVWRTEEKGSDVNLATYLLLDAFAGSCDRALVISNDTDLCEPIRIVTEVFGREVRVVTPRGHRHPAAALKKVATDVRRLRTAAVTASQLPAELTDDRGAITKPPTW